MMIKNIVLGACLLALAGTGVGCAALGPGIASARAAFNGAIDSAQAAVNKGFDAAAKGAETLEKVTGSAVSGAASTAAAATGP